MLVQGESQTLDKCSPPSRYLPRCDSLHTSLCWQFSATQKDKWPYPEYRFAPHISLHCVLVIIHSCLQNLLELETDSGSPNKSLEDFSYVSLESEGCY